MPKFKYVGTGPCRYGTTEVRPGDVIDASAKPGKNFVLLEDRRDEDKPLPPSRRRQAPSDDAEA